MIEGLFPPGVHTASAEIDDGVELHPDEAPLAASMSPKRRAEFASARACARRALAALGHGEAPILRGERRMPVWPEGVVGAITHTGGWCAAAVGRCEDWLGIGLDAETGRALSTRALERISSRAEREALAALPHGSAKDWGTVLFSAKESLYKALFPQTRIFLGFREAEIALQVDDAQAGAFSAELLQAESATRLGVRHFAGRFARDPSGERVVTALCAPR